jgi:hypothetical protein
MRLGCLEHNLEDSLRLSNLPANSFAIAVRVVSSTFGTDASSVRTVWQWRASTNDAFHAIASMPPNGDSGGAQ